VSDVRSNEAEVDLHPPDDQLPTPRHGCSGVALTDGTGRVLIIGGSDEKLGPLRVVEAWEPQSGRWRVLAPTYGERAFPQFMRAF
jgi:hypothetical protein